MPVKPLKDKETVLEAVARKHLEETEEKAKARQERPKGASTHDPTRRGTRRAPTSVLDIAVLARKRTRKMLAVLETIARDPEKPASSRVSAAKVLLDLAKFDPKDLKKLEDTEMFALAKAIIAKRAKNVAKEVNSQVVN